MNLRFAAVVIVVLFVGAPSLESIGARAQRLATAAECRDACSAAARRDTTVLRGYINRRIRLCNCGCSGNNGGGLLHASVRGRCVDCIDLITSSPSNCYCNDDRDNNGNTPLHLAAWLCYGPETDELLDAGCTIYVTDRAGNTPLCEVARTRNSGECGQVARTLVAAGGPACRRCSDGYFPCGGSVQQGVRDVLRQDGACNCSR